MVIDRRGRTRLLNIKKKEDMKVIEYLVQDCPIMGRVVERHYVDDDECVSKRNKRRWEKYGKR